MRCLYMLASGEDVLHTECKRLSCCLCSTSPVSAPQCSRIASTTDKHAHLVRTLEAATIAAHILHCLKYGQLVWISPVSDDMGVSSDSALVVPLFGPPLARPLPLPFLWVDLHLAESSSSAHSSWVSWWLCCQLPVRQKGCLRRLSSCPCCSPQRMLVPSPD